MLRKKEKRKDSIDLSDLKILSDVTPAKVWVNLLLLHMYKDSVGSFTLNKSKGIPSIPLEDEVPEGELDFDKIINRLKVMSGLVPVIYKEPHKGEIPLMLSGTRYTANTIFVDSGDNPKCEIIMSRRKT